MTENPLPLTNLPNPPKKPQNRFQSHWIASKIQQFRTEMNISQAELGAMLGVPQQRVSGWESGAVRMGRLYTQVMDNLAAKVNSIRMQATTERAFRAHIAEAFNIYLKEK